MIKLRTALAVFLMVFAANDCAAQQPGAAPRVAGTGVIAGKVLKVESGEPLRGARVSLAPQRRMFDMDEDSRELITDHTGEFSFGGLSPGLYSLSVERTGYVTQSYGERAGRAGQGGTPINLLSGQKMNDLLFRMVPGGVITGRVYDQYGDPMAKARVDASQSFGASRVLPVQNGETNDLGEYRLYGLAPGEYVVSATPREQAGRFGPPRKAAETAEPASNDPREVGGRTYYPGASEPTHASKIEVAAGRELGGIDITIRPVRVYKVRGRVALMDRIKPESVNLMLMSKESFGDYGGRASVATDGTFEIEDVPSGGYLLMAMVMDPEQGFTGSFSARLEVTVASSNVEGLQINLGGGSEVSGKIRVEGKPEVPKSTRIMLLSRSGEEFGGGHAQVNEDGTFTMKNVAPGTYMVTTSGHWDPAAGYYLKEVRLGMQDVRESLQVSGAMSGIEVILATDGGTLSGRVLTGENLPATGAMVLLVAGEGKGLALQLDAKFGQTDQNGNFLITAIRPGDYKIVAVDREEAESMATSLQGKDLPKSVLEQAKTIRIVASGQHTIETQVARLKM